MKKKIYGWCFQNKKTKVLEPLEDNFAYWHYGYGIFGTKKDLLENVSNEIPKGYKAKKVEIKLIIEK